MKKKSLALVLATGMAVTTFGGTGSAFADSKMCSHEEVQ